MRTLLAALLLSVSAFAQSVFVQTPPGGGTIIFPQIVLTDPTTTCTNQATLLISLSSGNTFTCPVIGGLYHVTAGAGGGGAAIWGGITGTITLQSDLANALALKEGVITSGTTTQAWFGNKVFRAIANGDLPTTLTAGTSGNAATATAFAATPGACAALNYVTGISANGTPTCSVPSGGGGGILIAADLLGAGSALATPKVGGIQGIAWPSATPGDRQVGAYDLASGAYKFQTFAPDASGNGNFTGNVVGNTFSSVGTGSTLLVFKDTNGTTYPGTGGLIANGVNCAFTTANMACNDFNGAQWQTIPTDPANAANMILGASNERKYTAGAAIPTANLLLNLVSTPPAQYQPATASATGCGPWVAAGTAAGAGSVIKTWGPGELAAITTDAVGASVLHYVGCSTLTAGDAADLGASLAAISTATPIIGIVTAGAAAGANATVFLFEPGSVGTLPAANTVYATPTLTSPAMSNGTLTLATPLSFQFPNEGTTGTNANKIAKLDPTTPGTARTISTADTSGVLGLCVAGCGITGNATIAFAGQVSCVFDGATTFDDYVIPSITNPGQCLDTGATYPTGGQQVIGRVLTTNASAGTYTMELVNGGKSPNLTNGAIAAAQYKTATNCLSIASPAVCAAAPAGSINVLAAATTEVVNTTVIGANSQVLLTFDASLGARLGVTCNTTYTNAWVTARTAGTSFTVTVAAAPTTNPACFSYTIVN